MATSLPRALRRLPLAATLPVLLAGCADTTTLGIDRYVLVAVDGVLPGAVPGREDVEVTGGVLEVRTDDRVEMRLDLRCTSGASCSLPAEWQRLAGLLDRTAGPPVADGLVRWSDGREATASSADGGVEVAFPLPPSQGVGTVVFRFE